MQKLARRHVLQVGGSAGLALVGARYLPTPVSAELEISQFVAEDDYKLTGDGSIQELLIDASISIEWSGFTGEEQITVSLSVKHPETGERDIIAELQEPLASTHGSDTFTFTRQDLLSSSHFSAQDFEVTEAGERKDTSIEFEGEFMVQNSEDVILSKTISTHSVISVERLGPPTIESFEISDSHPMHTHVDVGWAVQETQVSLDSVESELRFVGETTVLDSETSVLDGESASGEHNLAVNDTSDDGYEVTLRVTNAGQLSTTKIKTGGASDGDDEPPKDALDFEQLIAEVTDSRGNVDEPSEVTFEYSLNEETETDLEFSVDVDGATTTEEINGMSGIVEVDGRSTGSPSTSYATVTARIVGGPSYSNQIEVADGSINLLE